MPKLLENQQQMADQLKKLAEKLDSLQHTDETHQDSKEEVADIFQELELQKKKEKNVVVFGLEHGRKPKEALIALCQESLKLDVSDKLHRVTAGKNPKLIFASFNEVANNDLVLKSARLLRKSANSDHHNVYINQDFTPAQRSRLKQLRADLKERRSRGERVSIHGWKIVRDGHDNSA